MKCSGCGQDNPSDAGFCGGCGDSLEGFTAREFRVGDAQAPQVSRVSFQDAIALGFSRYTDFRGRSTRSEFWWWFLFASAGTAFLSVIEGFMGISPLLSLIFRLGTLIPSLALGARRLHDINKSGWWQLMWFGFFFIVPILVLFWWAIKPSDQGSNQHGPEPRRPV